MPGPIAWTWRLKREVLGPNLNRRTVVHERPDFFDLRIRDSNAAVGPVASAMCGAYETVAVRQAMDEDVPTRRHAAFACAFPIGSIRIGNMQRAVKLTLSIPAVDHVHALWCSVISLPRLR